MFSLGLEILSFNSPQKQKELEPKQFLIKLGQNCKFCNKKVVYSNSMCICQCKQYGHFQCIKKYLHSLKLKQQDLIKCQQCKKQIEITYEKQLKIGLNLKLQNSVLIIFICVALIFLSESIKQEFKHPAAERNLWILSLYFTMVVILIIVFLVLIVLSLIYNQFTIKDIKKSKNYVVASAFQGIVTPRQEQNSSNIIFT